jgi:hypothetical protein
MESNQMSITWTPQKPLVSREDVDFRTDSGWHGWIYNSGSWYLFGKHVGYDVMASGHANGVEKAKIVVEKAINDLEAAGWSGK